MNKVLISTAAIFTGVFATPAFAHPGVHDFGFVGDIVHLLTEPDHLLMGLGIATFAACVWRYRRMKKTR